MAEVEGVLFTCRFVMNTVTRAYVPYALAELSMSCRGQKQSQTQEKFIPLNTLTGRWGGNE